MSTIQIVGIAVAAVIVVLLVVALLVTRKGGGDRGEAGASAERTSFLDSPPSDTLSRLGAPEHVSPADAKSVEPVTPPEVVRTATGVASGAREGLGLDWDRADVAPGIQPPVPDESETTGEVPAVALAEPEAPVGPRAEATPDAESAGEPLAKPEAPAASDRLIPLSSIIVTTSTKMVDLEDPEIRRMLTELVTFEIDQATQFREQGQTVDAVLQLTEAEKICRALGKHDTAHEIRQMMRGLQD